jgi:hypothetical protein
VEVLEEEMKIAWLENICIIIIVIAMLILTFGPDVYGSKALKPDVVPPPQDDGKAVCQCIQFRETKDSEESCGMFCRCDHPDRGTFWFFEGDADGMVMLYQYLDEGVKQYYNELKQKRWPLAPKEKGVQWDSGAYERR